MSTIYPMQDMGLYESQATYAYPQTVDTSTFGGTYNTVDGQMGLWDSFKSKFDGGPTPSSTKPSQYSGWNAAGNVMGGIGALGKIFLGFESLGLLKDQNKLAKEKWYETKQELNHMRAVRKRLNTQYAG